MLLVQDTMIEYNNQYKSVVYEKLLQYHNICSRYTICVEHTQWRTYIIIIVQYIFYFKTICRIPIFLFVIVNQV